MPKPAAVRIPADLLQNNAFVKSPALNDLGPARVILFPLSKSDK